MLGKIGDILSIAPILQNEWRQTGQKQNLLVAKDYEPIAKRLPGVNPILFDGHFSELSRAIMESKRRFSKVVTLQVFGKDIAFQRWTPSFQLDQWMRGGVVGDFLNGAQLEVSSNSEVPEKLLSGKRTAVFADLSQSSPFEHKEELHQLMKSALPEHNVIRLSEIKLPSVLDFPPLFRHAELVVSVETSHLHLTRACSTPVIAMVTDQPTRWHGSAWHPRYRLHCRYGDFKSRKAELAKAMIAAVNKEKEPTQETILTGKPHGYNPSIIKHDGSVFTTYRWHDRNDWRTSMVLIDGSGREHEIKFPEELKDNSIEDGRLFTLNGKLMLSYVVAAAFSGQFRSAIGYGELVQDAGWKLAKHFQPKFGRNDLSNLQKNWVPFDHKGKLHFIYSSAPDQIIIRVEGDAVAEVFKSKGVSWPYEEIRGGCVIPHAGKMLRFFHSHTNQGNRDSWIYRVGASVMNPEPPFQTIKVCDLPVLSGNEKWTQCKHWKANVVFPAGVIESENGWKLAVGLNDCESVLTTIQPKYLNL